MEMVRWQIPAVVLLFCSIISSILAMYAVRYGRRQREQKRLVLSSFANLRGWRAVTSDGESIVSWTRKGPYACGNFAGTHKGLKAELVVFNVYKWRNATMAAVACGCVPQGLECVAAIEPKYKYATGNDVSPMGLGKRFRLTGKHRDLFLIFAPAVEKAILDFPGDIHSVTFDGKVACITWLGWETDQTIIDFALDLTAEMCRQAEAAAVQAS